MLEAEGGREMTFSEKLITLRAGRGWSQETLARELGVSRQAVGFNCVKPAQGCQTPSG